MLVCYLVHSESKSNNSVMGCLDHFHFFNISTKKLSRHLHHAGQQSVTFSSYRHHTPKCHLLYLIIMQLKVRGYNDNIPSIRQPQKLWLKWRNLKQSSCECSHGDMLQIFLTFGNSLFSPFCISTVPSFSCIKRSSRVMGSWEEVKTCCNTPFCRPVTHIFANKHT